MSIILSLKDLKPEIRDRVIHNNAAYYVCHIYNPDMEIQTILSQFQILFCVFHEIEAIARISDVKM